MCGARGSAQLRLLSCYGCGCHTHPTCLGLGPHAYAGGIFECASCVLLSACLDAAGPGPGPSSQSAAAQEVAHRLVWLRGKRTQDSTQATYASALHRYVYWGTAIMGWTPQVVLPPGRGVGVPTSHVEMFIAWAATKYKFQTVRSTVDALADWCKSKSAPTDSIRCKSVSELMKTAQLESGPSGLPQGKQGMSTALLEALVAHLGALKRADTTMAPLHTRDIAWLLLGFYGMLRRSELIGLKMHDVTLTGLDASSGHITLRVSKSKTDRQGVGALVHIAGVTGRHRADLWSPVKRYLDLRLAAGARPTDPFLVAWDLDNYRLSQDRPLTTSQALASQLTRHLKRLKQTYPGMPICPVAYGMHSLRRGGVLAAWEAGVDIHLIKAHGRWRSDNGMRPYMTAGLEIKLQVTSRM